MSNTDTVLTHITILRPRELRVSNSSRLNTDFMMELEGVIDRDKWKNRREFIIQTLSFCLGLSNLWRFPYYAFVEGQGAFVWLYIVFILVFGNALLLFEVVLGQFCGKGFHKVFSLCPLFEGVSYSMMAYCVLTSIYLNIINSYSFIQMFATFNDTLEYSTCGAAPQNICANGSTDQRTTPEYVYFFHRVVKFTEFEETDEPNNMSWRNMGVLFFLWVLMAILILRGIRTSNLPAYMFAPFTFITFFFVLVVSIPVDGTKAGLIAMFSIKLKNMFSVRTWRAALEQSLATLGIGMGPIITLGSYSDFKGRADRDCLYVCICALLGSLLSASVLFCGAGTVALERNLTVATVFKEFGRYPSDFSVQIVVSQLFSRMPEGLSHGTSFIYFALLIMSGWCSLVALTETFIVSCYDIASTIRTYKVYANLALCVGCFLVGAFLSSNLEYDVLVAFDRFLVMIGLVTIVTCELIAVIFFYGLSTFCDDVDFMLGFCPNIFYQVIWTILPVILMLLCVGFIYTLVDMRFTNYDSHIVWTIIVCIILPLVWFALYNLYKCYRNGNIRDVFIPADNVGLDDESSMYMQPSKNVFKADPVKGAKQTEAAGPSSRRW